MTHSPLVATEVTEPGSPNAGSDAGADRVNASWHDRVQIALAIADDAALKSLLLDCTPPIVQPHRLSSVRSAIGVPVSAGLTADGTLEFEEVHCILAPPEELEQGVVNYSRLKGNRRGYLDLIRCETDTQILGHAIPMANAISILTYGGFAAAQIQQILNLPYDGWYKSWWYQVDEQGQFTVPFLRLLRTRRFPDGTVTLQYKDFYAQEQPVCFKSCTHKVLVELLPIDHNFATILNKINQSRQQAQITRALLICDQIPDLEARGFISQHISLYASHQIALPVRADCLHCATGTCPMQGDINSPVLFCQKFFLEAT